MLSRTSQDYPRKKQKVVQVSCSSDEELEESKGKKTSKMKMKEGKKTREER